jgi:hypothetical protein
MERNRAGCRRADRSRCRDRRPVLRPGQDVRREARRARRVGGGPGWAGGRPETIRSATSCSAWRGREPRTCAPARPGRSTAHEVWVRRPGPAGRPTPSRGSSARAGPDRRRAAATPRVPQALPGRKLCGRPWNEHAGQRRRATSGPQRRPGRRPVGSRDPPVPRVPRLGIGQACRENVEVARISEEADQPQSRRLVTGKGPDRGAAALRIVFDAGLDVIDQQRHVHASICHGEFAQQLLEGSGHPSSIRRSSTSTKRQSSNRSRGCGPVPSAPEDVFRRSRSPRAGLPGRRALLARCCGQEVRSLPNRSRSVRREREWRRAARRSPPRTVHSQPPATPRPNERACRAVRPGPTTMTAASGPSLPREPCL